MSTSNQDQRGRERGGGWVVVDEPNYDQIVEKIKSIVNKSGTNNNNDQSENGDIEGVIIVSEKILPSEVRGLKGLVGQAGLGLIHATPLPQLSPTPNSKPTWIISGSTTDILDRAGATLRSAGRFGRDEVEGKGQVDLVQLGEGAELVSGLRLLNEVMGLGNTALSCEALALGTKTGMSTRMIWSAIRSALGNSWSWMNRIPKLLDGDYTGSQGDTVDEAIRVLTDYTTECKSLKISVPLLALVRQTFILTRTLHSGSGGDSTVSLIKNYAVDPRESKDKAVDQVDLGGEGGEYKGKVGFVGLGSMGLGMASILHKSGLDITGYDVWKGSSDKYKAVGAKTEDTAEDACRGANVVVLMVVNAEQAEGVLFDKGVAKVMAEGGAILLMSTVPPSTAKSLQEKLRAVRSDLFLLDCPVSGGVARAALGDLTLLCSGDEAGLKTAWPVLKAMSGTHGNAGNLWVIPGGVGNGSAVKMTHQALAGTQINLVTECMAFAARFGLPLRLTHKILLNSTGFCGPLGPRGKNMLDGKLQADSQVDIWLKDLGIVSDEGMELGVPVFYSTHVLQSSVMASSYGWGADDDSSLTRLWKPAGIEVTHAE